MVVMIGCGLGVPTGIVFPPLAVADEKDPNEEVQRDLDTLRRYKQELEDLNKKPNRTEEENERKRRLERDIARIEEGLRQWLRGAPFVPLTAETIQKIKDYFIDPLQRELDAERQKPRRERDRAKIEDLERRIEEIKRIRTTAMREEFSGPGEPGPPR